MLELNKQLLTVSEANEELKMEIESKNTEIDVLTKEGASWSKYEWMRYCQIFMMQSKRMNSL